MSRKAANVEYYKASGICSGFDLLALFVLEFLAVAVLSLPYVALSCFLDKGFGRFFSLFMLPLLTAWLNGWLAMVLVKHFKIRAPGLVFCTALLAAILGSLCAWAVVWGLGQNVLGFIEFFSTANQTMKSQNASYFILGLFAICCVIMSVLPLIQAGRPFNEEVGRWFKRKWLMPFKVFFRSESEFKKAIYGNDDLVNFFKGYGYKITSDANFVLNFSFSWSIWKFWFYYDKDVDRCYLVAQEHPLYLSLAAIPRVRNKAISRYQARLLYQALG